MTVTISENSPDQIFSAYFRAIKQVDKNRCEFKSIFSGFEIAENGDDEYEISKTDGSDFDEDDLKKVFKDELKNLLSQVEGLDVAADLVKICGYEDLGKEKIDAACAVFLKNNLDPSNENESKDIQCSKGSKYKIKKDGEEFKIFRFDPFIGFEEEIIDPHLQSFILREIAEDQIFESVKKNNFELFQTCIDVGVSKDIKDEKGRGLSFFVGSETSPEISKIIKDHNQKSQNLFRDLARDVRKAFIEKPQDLEAAINEKIEEFGQKNPDVDLLGLKAEDMIAFMLEISLLDDEKNPDYNKEGPLVQNFVNGKNEGGDDSENPQTKTFYRRLLLTCLEGDHRFLSEEHNDNIKNSLFEQVRDDFAKASKNAGEDVKALGDVEKDIKELNAELVDLEVKLKKAENDVSKSGDIPGLKEEIDKKKEASNFPKTQLANILKSAPEAVLNKYDSSNKILNLYKQVRFEELKIREGFTNDLTYEQFSEALAKVAVVAFEDKKESLIKASNKLIESCTKKLNEATTEEDREKQEKTLEGLKKARKKYEDRGQQAADLALDMLLNDSNKNLQVAVEILKKDPPRKIEEIGYLEISEKLKAIENPAAATIQAAFKKSVSFSIKDYIKAKEQIKTFLEEKDSFGNPTENPERVLSKKDLKYPNYIEELVGDKSITDNGYGLVIHDFKDDMAGLYKFNEQIQKANSKSFSSNEEAKFGIARIDNFKSGSSSKTVYAIATSNRDGVTTTFIDEPVFEEIQDRSREIYEENLDYIRTRDGIKLAIAILIDAQSKTFGLEDGSLKDKKRSSEEIGAEINLLRRCLRKIEINENDLPKDEDSQEEKDEKARKAAQKMQSFRDVLKKENLWKDDKFDAERLLNLMEKEKSRIPENFEEKKELLTKIFSGESTKDQREEARKNSAKEIGREMNARIRESAHNNKHKMDLDGLEKADLFSQYKSNSTKINYLASEKFLPNQKDGFNRLLSVKMPHSPYPGISITRPKGHQNKTVAITFNMKGDDFSTDTAWVALKISGRPYHARVSVCAKDEYVDVYKGGKLEKEFHKKGDIVIDTGVIFERLPNGTHKEIKISEIDSKTERKKVEEAFGDLKIKAVSIVDGKRRSAAVLYNGFSVETELQEKASYLQEVNDGKRFNKEGEKIKEDDVIFNCYKNGNIALSQEKLSIKVDGFEIDFGKEIECSFAEKLQNLTSDEQQEFTKKFSEHFGEELGNELLTAIGGSDQDEIHQIFTKASENRLSKLNTKFSVIHKDDNFKLAIPIDPTQEKQKDDFENNIKFSELKLEFVGADKKVERISVFGPDYEGYGLSKEFEEKSKDLDLNKIAKKIFSEEEFESFKNNGGIANENEKQNFCIKLKDYCDKTRVYVAFQEVERDGTKDGKDHYKKIGVAEIRLFDKEKGEIKDKIEPSGKFKSFINTSTTNAGRS